MSKINVDTSDSDTKLYTALDFIKLSNKVHFMLDKQHRYKSEYALYLKLEQTYSHAECLGPESYQDLYNFTMCIQ